MFEWRIRHNVYLQLESSAVADEHGFRKIENNSEKRGENCVQCWEIDDNYDMFLVFFIRDSNV